MISRLPLGGSRLFGQFGQYSFFQGVGVCRSAHRLERIQVCKRGGQVSQLFLNTALSTCNLGSDIWKEAVLGSVTRMGQGGLGLGGWVDEVALQTISRPDSQPKLGRKIKWELFCCKTAFCFNECKNLRYLYDTKSQ